MFTTNSKQTPGEAYFEPPVTTLGTDTVNLLRLFSRSAAPKAREMAYRTPTKGFS